MTDSVPELAAEIAPEEDPTASMRVALVTAVEVGGDRRVQLDISDAAWINRIQDCSLSLGDRVSVLQQGPVLLVIGRLTGPDAFTPIGAIIPFAGSTAPTGWLLCDGSAVARSTYGALFTICGTTYGAGNGTTTFNVPDLRNREVMGSGASFARGSIGGSATVSLSTGNLPSHDHGSGGGHGHSLSGSVGSVGDHSHSDSFGGSRSDLLAGGGSGAATAGGGSTGSAGGHSHSLSGSADSGGSHTHSSVGSGTSFSTTGPYLAVPYIIRAS